MVKQQLENVVKIGRDYYSGCQVDWNTILVGGHSKYLDVLDIRVKKIVCSQAMDFPVLQICDMTRISDH